MDNLMVFEGREVEVFEYKGDVLFNPKHVAECLDIKDVNSTLRNFNEKQVIKIKNSDVHTVHIRKLNNAGENFLTESGVYKLIFKSRKSDAEKFQDWVTDEVLPTIRKTGGFVANDDLFINTYFPHLDDASKMLFRGTLETVRKQNELIENQKETIVTQDTIISNVIKDDGLYAVGTVGKILKSYCKTIMGAKKIFNYMRDNKILMDYPDTQRHNLPYDRYSNLFDVKYVEVDRGFYSSTETKVYLKGNGLKWLLNKLVKDGHMTKSQSEEVKNQF